MKSRYRIERLTHRDSLHGKKGMVNIMEIGKIIKKLRRESGYTQEELAEIIGVTSQAVSKWESGAGLPDISQVVPLARALDVNTDVLFGNNEAEENRLVRELHERINVISAEPKYDYNATQFDNSDELVARIVALYEEFLHELPTRYDLYLELAGYFAYGEASRIPRAMEIYKRVLERSPDISIRTEAMHSIANALSQLSYDAGSGTLAEAQEWAEQLPSVEHSREYMLSRLAFTKALITLGETQLNHGVIDVTAPSISKEEAVLLLKPTRDNLLALLLQAFNELGIFAELSRRLGTADKDEFIALSKSHVALSDLLCTLDADVFGGGFQSSAHHIVARAYGYKEDIDNTLEHIEHSAEYAMQFPNSATKWPTALDDKGRNIGEIVDTTTWKVQAQAIESAPQFKHLRKHPRFIAVLAKLRA